MRASLPAWQRSHGIPLLWAVCMALVGCLMTVLLFYEQRFYAFPVIFFLAGATIGYLTPKGTVDHRGTNGVILLVIAWTGFYICSGWLFPEVSLVSDWFIALMENNVIVGFAIIIGALLGSTLRQ